MNDDAQNQPGADEQDAQSPNGATTQNDNDLATLKKEIADLRKESANYRTKLRAAESQAKANESAESRIAQLEQSYADLQKSTVESAVTAVAAQLGFYDAAIAPKLIDVTNIDHKDTKAIAQTLTALAKQSPYLIKPQVTDASNVGDRNPNEADMNVLLRKLMTK